MFYFEESPIEIQVQILSNLSREDLIICRSVCSHWKEMIQYHHLIDRAFTEDDFRTYLKQICFNFNFIKRNIDRIPSNLYNDIEKIYFEKKSLDGMIFFDKTIRECNRDYLKHFYVNNDIEMSEHFKQKYPSVYEIYQNKINGIFNDDVLRYASFITAFKHSPKIAKEWIRDEDNWEYVCLEDANEIVKSGLWKRCRKIIVSCLDCPINDMLLNLGIEKISKYILARAINWEFEIKVPNRDAIMLCGYQIDSESIGNMIEANRLDLAYLIASFRPKHQYDLFYILLSHRYFEEAIEQLKKLDVKQLDIHYIHSGVTLFGSLDILLTIYDQMKLQFPFCPQCSWKGNPPARR